MAGLDVTSIIMGLLGGASVQKPDAPDPNATGAQPKTDIPPTPGIYEYKPSPEVAAIGAITASGAAPPHPYFAPSEDSFHNQMLQRMGNARQDSGMGALQAIDMVEQMRKRAARMAGLADDSARRRDDAAVMGLGDYGLGSTQTTSTTMGSAFSPSVSGEDRSSIYFGPEDEEDASLWGA